MTKFKENIIRVIEATGGLALLRFLTRNRPRILMYHRVIDEPFVAGLPPERFAQQMAYIAQKFRVIPVNQLIEELARNDVKHYTLALTFDDGHADFYHNTWPIIKKYQLPASLYVTTGFIDQDLWLWPDLLRYILLKANSRQIALTSLGNFSTTRDEVIHTWSQLGDHCLTLDDAIRKNFIQDLAQQLNVTIPAIPEAPFTSLIWSQLREMHKQGLDIGSHTVSHPILSKLTSAAIESELHDSRERICEEIGQQPLGICYPNGLLKDINDDVLEIAQQLNYRYGLLACNATLDAADLFSLGRIAATQNITQFKWLLGGIEKPQSLGETLQKHHLPLTREKQL